MGLCLSTILYLQRGNLILILLYILLWHGVERGTFDPCINSFRQLGFKYKPELQFLMSEGVEKEQRWRLKMGAWF